MIDTGQVRRFLCSDIAQFRGRKIAATAAQGGEHPIKRKAQGLK